MSVQSFTDSMPLLTATSVSGLGRRHWSSPQQYYLHCLSTLYGSLSLLQGMKHIQRTDPIMKNLPLATFSIHYPPREGMLNSCSVGFPQWQQTDRDQGQTDRVAIHANCNLWPAILNLNPRQAKYCHDSYIQKIKVKGHWLSGNSRTDKRMDTTNSSTLPAARTHASTHTHTTV